MANPPPITDIPPNQLDQVIQDYHDAGAINVITTKQDDGNFTVQAIFVKTAGSDQIVLIAAASAIADYPWQNRGVAPAGYIKGMAVVYARVYCKFKAGDAIAIDMARANSNNGEKDALAWYSERFAAAGMNNDHDGADTLRHLFVLLIGLGMRESSGRYCEGWDRGKLKLGIKNTENNSEAGLFQVSFDINPGQDFFKPLVDAYSSPQPPSGFKEIFAEGVHPKTTDASVGSGVGFRFQELTKNSPAFAAEFAAVVLRHIRHEWGPIGARAAEIPRECDAMLIQVQNAVDSSNLCPV